jgi:tripartite-type tricarboxylate transporter receptor subunit TctC
MRLQFNAWATACTAVLALACAGAQAQTQLPKFPSHPIKIVVPFGPGGLGDVSTRIVAKKMGDQMGQQVYIENIPSAGGITAAQNVARSAPDGYTLFLMSNANAVAPSLFKALPYDALTDFQPISTLGFFDIVLVVDKSSPLKTVAEVIAAGKKNPDKFNTGSIVTGSSQNLSAALFTSMAGLTSPVVPFKTSGEVLTALKTGDIQIGFEMLPPIAGQIKAGSLRAIAVASAKRLPSMPEVPTIAESGVPGYLSTSWNGWAAPAKTPRDVLMRLNAEMVKALDSPEVKKLLVDSGVEARSSTPEAFKALLESETVKWRRVIEAAKIEKQ